jgi:hypothetical protein
MININIINNYLCVMQCERIIFDSMLFEQMVQNRTKP